MAGIAGVMGGLVFNQVYNQIGFIAGLKAFTAAVVGGIGSIPGAMLGGMLIGLAESFFTADITSTYTNLIVFGILIIVLLVRPSGLLGKRPAPEGMTPPPSPEIDQPTSAQVGVDEWVARSGHRREYAPGWRGDAQRLFERVGWWQRLAIAAVFGVLVPFLTVNDFQLQVGINALLLALLALGLNIAVGWAGLLDLGYIAFYGFGAYGFALLSSNQLNSPTGIHLAALVSVPIVMVGAAVLGLLVGLPSRRLIGDYLAIITLFFGEAFVEFTNNVAPSKLGGPNGIIGIDPYKLPIVGQLTTNKQLLLPAARAARHLDRGAPPARHLAHGPGVARRPRGPARRGHDDDPGQPGEADGVQLRRGRRRARRDRVRRAADQRVPDRLRHAVPDPDLRRR